MKLKIVRTSWHVGDERIDEFSNVSEFETTTYNAPDISDGGTGIIVDITFEDGHKEEHDYGESISSIIAKQV